VTPEKVQTVVNKIIEIAMPRKIILFGSYVLGKTHDDSDLDVMVVTADDMINPRKESVRIRRALKGILMSIDIIVVPETILALHAESPGFIYREALKQGRVVYDAT
jgi:predicted nucleotidyltransferase